MAHVLVVDDQETNRVTLERILRRESWEVTQAPDGQVALDQVREQAPDVMVTDLKMPGLNGLELLKAVRAIAPEVEVILMTAYGTVETAVDAMKEGAYDYVTKPLKRSEIVSSVRKALEKHQLVQENRALRAKLEQQQSIIGTSTPMRQLLEEAAQVASSDASVLMVGDSGTGKGLLARRIHQLSARTNHPLITVNCGAIPEGLIESELFGHEKGAFTGASSRKAGRFELAHEGTLFLDEVTALHPAVQVKLLRVLQEGEYERVGGTETLCSDTRILSATNLNIEEEVAAGRFREDLYYRLNVIQLTLPPLIDRAEDIPLLATHFLQIFAAKNKRSLQCFSTEAMDAMTNHPWPGNVRELQNAVERAVVLARGERIELNDLPPAVRQSQGHQRRVTFAVGTPLKDIERTMIQETMRQADGDRSLAASLLGITSRTIYRKEAEWAQESPLD
ncbi:MAG: sigma-54 dependent transcriptional regulator [Myxococcota bacterium]|nr:sigma-54 dependent transcriptional regulator [Myxococcota bacterium]